MDKYEFNVKVEQIKKLVNRGDFATAMKIADTIDWHRVRNTSLLSMIAQIYEKNNEYQEAKDILLLAFERAPIGKRLLYKLTDLALKEGSVAEAEAYYREFCDLAPEDPRQYLLRYLILKTKKAPLDQLIRALETYTSSEVDEKWLYELAELYHKGNMEEKCVGTCDRIMLLFGLGKYVDKAMDLKLEYAPLNKYQMDLVENRDKYEAKLRAVEEGYITPSDQEDYEEERQPDSGYDVNNNVVVQLHEDAQTQKLAQEMSRLSEEDLHTAEVEEDDMDATRTLDDLHTIKEIKPTKRVLDLAAEREAIEANREIERQKQAIRAAKEREEMEEEALRRAEEERELARREEEERRQRKQAEIDRERAMHRMSQRISEEPEEYEEPEAPETNHLMIEAESEDEGIAMAREALRKIHQELGHVNPAVKISSEKLNHKGIMAVAEKLAGKDLIIEHAAGLTATLLGELNDLMDADRSGMIVVLIDTPSNMEYLHSHYMALAEKFQYIGVKDVLGEERVNDPETAVNTVAEDAAAYSEKTEAEAASETISEVTAENEAAIESEAVTENEVEQALKRETDAQERIARDMEPVREEPSPAAAPVREAASATPVVSEAAPLPAAKPAAPASARKNGMDQPMDLEEFAQYACKYAADIDCSITGKSLLALYERIEMMEEDGEALTPKAAEDLIERAADKAEKPSLGKRLTSLFAPKYDKEGYLILREDNFFDD